MSSFGFGKPAEKREKTIDKAGLPRGPIVVDPASERDAVARGEQLGYVDRGQTDTQPSGAAGMLVCSVIPPKGTQEKLWCEVKSFASNQKPRFSVPFPDAKI